MSELKVFSESDAARILGLHRHTLRRYRRAGEIKAVFETQRFCAYSLDEINALKKRIVAAKLFERVLQ